MNTSDLTAEQLAPMSARDVSVALASGAGCGKTTVLTERFLSLLEGDRRLPLSRIVALTFTDKAARELRQRVRDGCRKRIAAGLDRAHWRQVLRGLEAAKISTFHSFCGDVLRRYAIEANIDPAFAILDETLAPTFRERTLDISLRRWLAARDPDFASLAVDYGLTPIREALGDILEKRPAIDLDDWSSIEPQDILARWETYQARVTAPLLERFAMNKEDLLKYLGQHQSSHTEMAARCARLIARIPLLPGEAKPVAALKEIREDARVQGGGKKTDWPSEEIYEYVKLALSSLRGEIDKLVDLLAPDGGRSLAAAQSGIHLARLARDLISSYDEMKKAAGMLDFNDLQKLVQKLLKDGPRSVAESLASSIDALLVDEFQDTDAVQAEILESLAGEGATSGRLFLVGDAKQSIYGFRGAEPRIFQSFRERFPSDGQLNLTENFRSVPAILGFVNSLFADSFPGTEHRLRPGGKAIVREDDATAVEFLWTGRNEKADATLRRKVEASVVSRMLALRLKAGWKVRVPQTRSTRDARPGDVAILFRSRSDFPIYEQALAAVGLDYHVVGGSTYFAQQEVIDLMNLLSAIEDPLDALALAGVLRGPFFGVSDEGLYWLANSGSAGLVESFAAPNSMHTSLAPDDAIAVARAVETLRRWRDRKDKMPIAELLDRVLKESGFEAALMGEFLGGRKRANVRKLVRLARKFDARGSLTLADFVARLRADVKTPPREEQAATSDEAGLAIRLMTIHQAKGLEFPIVVLADLDRKPPQNSDLVAYHPDLGLLFRPRGDADGDESATRNFGRDLASIEEARAGEDEEIRVFYVATTRARDALILAAGRATNDPPKSPAMRLLARTFDLSTGASLADPEPGLPAAHATIINPVPIAMADVSTTIRFRPKLLLTARTIHNAQSSVHDGGATVIEIKPKYINLVASDLLTPSLREVDRLIHAALDDPLACRDGDAVNVIESAAERLGALVPSRIKVLAIDSLRGWRETPACCELAVAGTLRRSLRWSMPWPSDEESATVYVGRIDFAHRDAAGSWHLIQISVNDPSDRDRLNLILGAHALSGGAIAPVISAEFVTLGKIAHVERIGAFGCEDVDRAVAAFVTSASHRRLRPLSRSRG